jgi:hypothetical protein
MARKDRRDADGRFTMNGVAPGDYKVFAWESARRRLPNADFIRKYENRGVAITVLPRPTDTRFLIPKN